MAKSLKRHGKFSLQDLYAENRCLNARSIAKYTVRDDLRHTNLTCIFFFKRKEKHKTCKTSNITKSMAHTCVQFTWLVSKTKEQTYHRPILKTQNKRSNLGTKN